MAAEEASQVETVDTKGEGEDAREGVARIFIVAGEDSGDLHASNLIREMSVLRPEIRFEGFGGDRMNEAGCLVHVKIVHLASMGFSFLQNVRSFLKLIRQFYRLIVKDPPDALVLVDFPGFNFILARMARYRGIPVVYYICPQIWAWAPWRRRKILKLTDLQMVILPFEEAYYRSPGHRVVHVGHPLADALVDEAPPEERARALRQHFKIRPGEKIIGLFPGSRVQEVRQLLPYYRGILDKMKLQRGQHRIVISSCQPEFRPLVEESFESFGVPIDVWEGDSHPVMAACELAMVASGTATLELAYFRKPMLVLYRLTRANYYLFRCLCTSPYISLVNILGGREIVPEAIDFRDRTEEHVKKALELLDDSPARRECLESLDSLRWKLFRPGASRRAAETLAAFIQEKTAG